VWNPFRSKLAAGILGGLDNIHVSAPKSFRSEKATEEPQPQSQLVACWKSELISLFADPTRRKGPLPRCRLRLVRLARLGHCRPRGRRLRRRVLTPIRT
jgi:hypothetical protein